MAQLTQLFYFEQVEWYVFIDAFFLYSFLGWVMECIVIRREKGIWENRGFARLPFCIIYGFGAMLGFFLLKPFSERYLALYIVGALAATVFEYLTAKLMLHLFGELWWDYTHKKWNYKGILCLESTLGWGLIAVLLFVFLHRAVFEAVMLLPQGIGTLLAVVLLVSYASDFMVCAQRSFKRAKQNVFTDMI